jgi:hypothetical protein
MSQPSDFELLELATPYALDAVTDAERADIERRLAEAPKAVADAFHKEVREVRETLAAMSSGTAVEPPGASAPRAGRGQSTYRTPTSLASNAIGCRSGGGHRPRCACRGP